MLMQTKVLRTHSIINYFFLSGLIITLALMSGCSQSGGISDENQGPNVPFELNVGGDSVSGESTGNTNIGNIKFDATIPQDGSFDGTFDPDVDTVDSVCSFDCHPANSVGNRCYTDDSEELGGTLGHSIEVTIVGGTLLAAATPDAKHTGRFIECTVTPGQSCNANCVGRVPDNEPTRLDNLTLDVVFDETAISTGTGTAAGIRLAYLAGRDDFGDSLYATAGGTVVLDPGTSPITVYGGFTPDLDFDADANGNQYAEIMYTIDDRSVQTRVLAFIRTSYPLEVTQQSYSDLLGIIQYCSEIGVCPNPLESTLSLSYFSPLSGASFSANPVSGTNLTANFTGTAVTFRDEDDQLAYTARYDEQNATFTTQNISGTVTVTSVTRLDFNAATGIEHVAYQRADDGTGVVARFDANSQAFITYATISDITDGIDIASDSAGTVYVSYTDANSVTRVVYLDTQQVAVDTDLERHLITQFPNFSSVVEVSNLEYDAVTDSVIIAVTWLDAAGNQSLSVHEYTFADNAWAQRGSTFTDASTAQATAIEIRATDQGVSTVISYHDNSGNIYAALYDGVDWVVLPYPSVDGFAAVDTSSRSSVTFDSLSGTVYLVASDANGDTVVIESTLATQGWSTVTAGGIERGSVDNPTIRSDGFSMTVSYEKDDNGIIERRTSGGRILDPTDRNN